MACLQPTTVVFVLFSDETQNDNPSPGGGHEWGKKFLALTREVNLHNQPIKQKLRSEIHGHSSP